MQAVMLYLTMSATLCALRMVTTVMLGAGTAIAGATAAPTVKFVLTDVTSVSPSCRSSTCATAKVLYFSGAAMLGCPSKDNIVSHGSARWGFPSFKQTETSDASFRLVESNVEPEVAC